ncbi:SphA family protein [Aerosticca soli]|nr:transporter [Aerosticca soli]MDI3261997.1 transporter [Fulvimonas sp.]
MKHWMAGSLLAAAAAPTTALADASAHYVPGVEGIKAASVPPAGLYLRLYGVAYRSDDIRVDTPSGNGAIPGHTSADVDAFVPRIIWISDKKFLGADFGMDALWPYEHKHIEVGPMHTSKTGMGDLYLNPVILAWHGKQYDTVFCIGYWTDVGDYHREDPASTGQGYSNAMFTLGGTWYPDSDRRWALSILNRYETLASKIRHTDVTPGDNWVAEWGISYQISPSTNIGLVGYDSWQVERDDAPHGVPTPKDSVHAVGGQWSFHSHSLGMLFDVALYHEYDAQHHPKGNTGRVTLTIPF